jgi:diacylglycerol O-acyltransferase / wax synthase
MARRELKTSALKKQPPEVARPAKFSNKAPRQLNLLDSAFLQLDTVQTPMTGGFLHIYAPVPGEDAAKRYPRLIRHIERCVDKLPILRRAIVRAPLDIDYGWFADGVDVDLGYHVRHTALPVPGAAAQLNDAYARIMVQPMDLTRPLWEIHIVDGVNAIDGVPRGGFAMIVKFHHAGVDGRSAAEIIASLHRTDDKRSNAKPRPFKPVPLPPPPTLLGALLRSAERYTRFSTALGQAAAGRIPALGRNVGKLLSAKASVEQEAGRGGKKAMVVPRTLFNVPVSTDRIYTHLSLSLDQIKRIRERVDGATVNDVYLAVVGGALRSFLKDRAALPRQSLVAMVTMDVRGEEDKGKGGNQFAVARVPVGTNEPDAARRLTSIVAATARAKSSVKGKGKAAPGKPVKWTMIVPAPLLLLLGSANRLGLATRVAPFLNLGATNVPGPRQILYLDGARLIDFSGAPPFFHGIGLAVNATSYDNALRVSVSACRKEIPEPERMRKYLQDSFAELTKTQTKGPAKPTVKKAAPRAKAKMAKRPARINRTSSKMKKR